MHRANRRVSPAMVVACLALFVALAGTSIAAVSQLVPRNSVGTVQLKNNAVSTAKVRNNSITTAKVLNRTLRAADFALGQIPPGPAGPAGPPGAAGPAGPAGTGATVAFAVTAGPNATTTTSASYVDVPNASASVTVPAGGAATLLLTFTGESACSGGDGFCRVRILVDGNEAEPAVNTDFAFDSSDGNTETSASYESHAVQRSVAGVAAGAHTVTVKYSVFGTPTLRLDDWSLSVLALRS